jgi:1-acyl-sn-glycerol-3-phosphate acyltransferase
MATLRAPMHFWYWLFWNITRKIADVYFRRIVHNPERVPAQGPCILAANHACYYDPFLLGTGIDREIYYLARKSAFFFPLGAFLRRCNAVPMDRDGGGVQGMLRIIEILKQGNGITLFPEGTRTPDGQMKSAKSGIGLIVIKSGAPVVPIRIFGAYEAWNRHMILPRPRRVIVKYGRTLDFSALRAEAEHCPKDRLKQIYQEVSDRIMDAIAHLEAQPD